MTVNLNTQVVIPINDPINDQINDQSIAVRGVRVSTIEELTVKEIEVLKQISQFKRGAIVGTAALGSGIFGAGIVAFLSGGNIFLSGSAFFLGFGGGGYAAWKKIPDIVKVLLSDEYNGKINDIFNRKLNGKLVPLLAGIENERSFEEGELLLTAFKIQNPKSQLHETATFTLEQVQRLLKTKVIETHPLEYKYDFWRGDFVPDYETTERVNRYVIAIIQKIISDLNPVPEDNEVLTDKQRSELLSIQNKLNAKLLEYHQNMFENLKKTYLAFNNDICEDASAFYNSLLTNSTLKITKITSSTGNLGSLIELTSSNFKNLHSVENINFRKAFNREYPLSYIEASIEDKSFKRIIECPSIREAKSMIKLAEFNIRGYAFEYEKGDIFEREFKDSVNNTLAITPHDDEFEKRMLDYVKKTIENVTKSAPGYLKRELKK